MEDGTVDIVEYKTGWTKVVGIISIVLGVIGLGCGGIGAVFLPIQASAMERLTEGAPPPAALSVGALDYALIGVGLVLAAVFLFAGILCTAGRPACRWMFVVYGVINIPLGMFNYTYQMGKQDEIRAWAKDYPDTPLGEMMIQQQQSGGQAIGEVLGLVMVLVFGVLIPAFYIIWFGFVKTKPEQYTGGDEGVV